MRQFRGIENTINRQLAVPSVCDSVVPPQKEPRMSTNHKTQNTTHKTSERTTRNAQRMPSNIEDIRHKTCLALAAFVLFTTPGCVNRAAQKQATKVQAIVTDPVQPVVAVPVVLKSLTETKEITGQVTTSSDAQIGTKYAGRLVAVYVKDGDPVKKGQVIAEQDTSTQRITLQQSLAAEASARSQLTQAIANMRV